MPVSFRFLSQAGVALGVPPLRLQESGLAGFPGFSLVAVGSFVAPLSQLSQLPAAACIRADHFLRFVFPFRRQSLFVQVLLRVAAFTCLFLFFCLSLSLVSLSFQFRHKGRRTDHAPPGGDL